MSLIKDGHAIGLRADGCTALGQHGWRCCAAAAVPPPLHWSPLLHGHLDHPLPCAPFLHHSTRAWSAWAARQRKWGRGSPRSRPCGSWAFTCPAGARGKLNHAAEKPLAPLWAEPQPRSPRCPHCASRCHTFRAGRCPSASRQRRSKRQIRRRAAARRPPGPPVPAPPPAAPAAAAPAAQGPPSTWHAPSARRLSCSCGAWTGGLRAACGAPAAPARSTPMQREAARLVSVPRLVSVAPPCSRLSAWFLVS